jgi:amino acid transporter
MTQIIDIAAVCGLFSCFLAITNATVRVVYSMGRDAVLPSPLGWVHKRFSSPYVAIYVLTAVSVVGGVGLSIWLGSGITEVYGWTGSIGTAAVIIVYILANVSLIKFFWRDPARNFWLHIVFPVLGIAAVGYALYSTAKPGQSYPYNLVPWVTLGWIVAGAVAYSYLKAKDPAKLKAVGRSIAEEEEDLAEAKLASGPVRATS